MECFLKISYQSYNVMSTALFDWLSWKPKCKNNNNKKKIKEKIKKKDTQILSCQELYVIWGRNLVEIFTLLAFTDFVFIIKLMYLVKLPWQLRFSIDLQFGKLKKRHLLPGHCGYIDKTFTEIFLEWSCIIHIIVFLVLIFQLLQFQLLLFP